MIPRAVKPKRSNTNGSKDWQERSYTTWHHRLSSAIHLGQEASQLRPMSCFVWVGFSTAAMRQPEKGKASTITVRGFRAAVRCTAYDFDAFGSSRF